MQPALTTERQNGGLSCLCTSPWTEVNRTSCLLSGITHIIYVKEDKLVTFLLNKSNQPRYFLSEYPT